MWWRFATACVLIAAIILCGALVLTHMRRVCDTMIELIDSSSSDLKGIDDLRRAKQLWQRYLPLVCCYVIHDLADAVSERLERAEAFSITGAEDEYAATLLELKMHIELIRDYDKLTVRSIF